MATPHRRARRGDETGGSTTISLVVLTPVLTLLLFAAFQAALWNHARTQARVTARTTAARVARAGAAPVDAQADAITTLTGSDIHHPSVTITVVNGQVVVHVTGDAPGIVIGTSSSVDVQVAMTVEGWDNL